MKSKLLLLIFLMILGLSSGCHKSASSNSETSKPSELTTNSKLGNQASQVENKIIDGDLITASEINGLSADELRLLRNTVLARHGRIYRVGDLEEYFKNRPWYKPREDYTESNLTPNDISNIELIQGAENPNKNSESVSASTSTPQPQPSQSGNLTNAQAQHALNSFISSFGGQVTVVGIQERPQQNDAKVDIKFTHFKYHDQMMGYSMDYSDLGTAMFSKYNNGKWVLTLVDVPGYRGNHWNINIPAD